MVWVQECSGRSPSLDIQSGRSGIWGTSRPKKQALELLLFQLERKPTHIPECLNIFIGGDVGRRVHVYIYIYIICIYIYIYFIYLFIHLFIYAYVYTYTNTFLLVCWFIAVCFQLLFSETRALGTPTYLRADAWGPTCKHAHP